jgi:hypothetical protein
MVSWATHQTGFARLSASTAVADKGLGAKRAVGIGETTPTRGYDRASNGVSRERNDFRIGSVHWSQDLGIECGILKQHKERERPVNRVQTK